MATKTKPAKREFTVKQMKEQQLKIFEERQLKQQLKLEQQEKLTVEMIFNDYMLSKQENYRQNVEQYKQYLQQIETQQIFVEIPVEEIAFTTCRICEFSNIWGARPPTNCGFCCANMKFF